MKVFWRNWVWSLTKKKSLLNSRGNLKQGELEERIRRNLNSFLIFNFPKSNRFQCPRDRTLNQAMSALIQNFMLPKSMKTLKWMTNQLKNQKSRKYIVTRDTYHMTRSLWWKETRTFLYALTIRYPTMRCWDRTILRSSTVRDSTNSFSGQRNHNFWHTISRSSLIIWGPLKCFLCAQILLRTNTLILLSSWEQLL